MLENFGLSFLPGAEQQDRASDEPTAQLADVIRILSMRLPRVLGARPIAPDALLTSPGSRGNPLVDSIVGHVLRNVPSAAPLPSGGDNTATPFARLLQASIPGGGAETTVPAIPPPRVIPIAPPTSPETPIATGAAPAPPRVIPLEPEPPEPRVDPFPRRRTKYGSQY